VTRGAARERAILDATIDLLGEVGYANLTMDAVAARAHASKNTIYRRWPGKPELVGAALDAHDAAEVAAVPDTGTMRGDLLAALRAACARVDQRYAVMMTSLLHAMRVDPRLADVLRSHVADDGLSPFPVIVGRAVARGELGDGTAADLAHQAAEGLVLRRMLLDQPLDEEFLATVVDDLLIPLLTRHATGD
jgi:AcrR family transcriptional regulator